jgi:hypothetical protein
VHFLITLLTFVLIAYHVRIRRLPTWRQVGAYVLAVNAVAAFSAGFYVAVQEDARSRSGRIVQGVVTERISSTGELGTRRIGLAHVLRGGPGYDALRSINTIEGSEFYQVIARQILTRSAQMWVVDYSYDCGRLHPCFWRDFVTHEKWLQLGAGMPVDVRYVPDGIGGARLDNNPQWATAIVEMTLGALLMLVAASVFGMLPSLIRRTKRLETMAVVSAVERVQCGGAPRWRVRFSYLDDLGHPREATDEFAIDEWKVGDTGIATYEVAEPGVAGLRREEPVATPQV